MRICGQDRTIERVALGKNRAVAGLLLLLTGLGACGDDAPVQDPTNVKGYFGDDVGGLQFSDAADGGDTKLTADTLAGKDSDGQDVPKTDGIAYDALYADADGLAYDALYPDASDAAADTGDATKPRTLDRRTARQMRIALR